MAKYYRVSKTPTVFEQTDEGITPLTSASGFTDWGSVQDISEEELQGLRDRFGVSAPSGVDVLKEIETGNLYKYNNGSISQISAEEAAGGTIGEIGSGALKLFKLEDIKNVSDESGGLSDSSSLTSVMPTEIKSILESKYGVSELETEKQSSLSKLLESIKSLPSKLTSKREELFEGVEEKRQIASDLQTEIAEKEAEYEKSIQSVEGEPMSLASIRGEQERQTILANVVLKGLNAKLLAAQGDYESAYQLATDAYNDYKETAQLELTAAQTELDLISEQLSSVEEDVAEDLQLILDERTRELEVEEKLEDQKIQLMLQYLSAGINMSDSFDVAIEKAKVVASEEEKLQLEILGLQKKQLEADINYTLAQTSKIYADIDSISGGTLAALVGGAGFIPNGDLTADQQKTIDVLLGGFELVDQVEKLYYAAAGEGESGTAARISGLINKIGSIAGLSEDWKIYQDFLDSNRAPIAKGLKGEVGNLTEQEQKKALKAFPSIYSTKNEAAAAFANIRQQMVDKLGVYGTLTNTPNWGNTTATENTIDTNGKTDEQILEEINNSVYGNTNDSIFNAVNNLLEGNK